MNLFEEIISYLNGIIWGVPAMIAVAGVGIYLTIRTGGIQFRKMGYSLKMTFGKLFSKHQAAEGATTPFQSLCTALAGTVGTGNIAGVAGAIAIGGPGAVFWMWIAALLGMATKFAEVTLSVHFREKNEVGDWVGGPMYYIKNGLSKNWKFLSVLFAIFGTFAVFGTGNATQVSTIIAAINSALLSYEVITPSTVGTSSLIIGIVIAALVLLILVGGIKRIGKVTETLIPFMAAGYIILALGLMALNYNKVPGVLADIFYGAFNPSAVTGGVVGSVFLVMSKGVSRGIFSNEAGLGTGSIAHASADTSEPVRQGLYGVFEVFIDTIVICTLTAMVILCSGINIEFGKVAGAELTIGGFIQTYGVWVSIFTAIALVSFAFSTILGWGLYGSRCLEFLFGTKIIKPFIIVYSLLPIIASTVDLGLIWGISEVFNGLMAIPNLIAIFLLSGTFFKLLKEFFKKYPTYSHEQDLSADRKREE